MYEEKVDGWRIVAYKDGARVHLRSRHGVDHTRRFAELAAAIARLKSPTLILDGEICVFDARLVSQFHLLADSSPNVACTPPVFMAFDVLSVGGVDVRGLPLYRRRGMLEQEIAGARMVYSARRLANNGHRAWETVQQRGYEGFVGKDPESTYRGGPTRAWLKMKIRHEGAFVIGGLMETEDGGFVALVGERDGDRLTFRGSVEYGFGRAMATDLLARAKTRQTSPFTERLRLRGATWFEPRMMAEITYSEVMNGRLRDPVYRGLSPGR